MDISQIPDEIRLFAIFAGRSGGGKSVAAASLPRPFQEIDTDLRANGIINAVKQGFLDPTGIDIVQFDPFSGFLKLQDHLNSLYNLQLVNKLNLMSLDFGSATSMVRLLDLSTLNLPKNTPGIGHLNLAGLSMTGPADYKFESQAFHKIVDFMRVLNCNVTMAAHIVDKYGRAPGAKETDPQVKIGEKLTLGTANLAENILAVFNDVYIFSKLIVGGEDKYFIEFNTEMAKNTYGIPPGKMDITRKSFWLEFQKLVKAIKDKTFKREDFFGSSNSGGLIL